MRSPKRSLQRSPSRATERNHSPADGGRSALNDYQATRLSPTAWASTRCWRPCYNLNSRATSSPAAASARWLLVIRRALGAKGRVPPDKEVDRYRRRRFVPDEHPGTSPRRHVEKMAAKAVILNNHTSSGWCHGKIGFTAVKSGHT